MPDPFLTLGLEPRLQLDRGQLEARHRELNRALHPDRFVGKPNAERRLALSRAIEVNHAFRILKDPGRRAEALLDRLGIDSAEGTNPPLDPAFLEQTLDLRQQLADSREASNLVSVQQQGSEIESRLAEALEELGDLFPSFEGDHPPERPPPETVRQIRDRVARIRVYQRFLEEVRAIQDELD